MGYQWPLLYTIRLTVLVIPSCVASDLVPIGNASSGSLPVLLWSAHKHHSYPVQSELHNKFNIELLGMKHMNLNILQINEQINKI